MNNELTYIKIWQYHYTLFFDFFWPKESQKWRMKIVVLTPIIVSQCTATFYHLTSIEPHFPDQYVVCNNLWMLMRTPLQCNLSSLTARPWMWGRAVHRCGGGSPRRHRFRSSWFSSRSGIKVYVVITNNINHRF